MLWKPRIKWKKKHLGLKPGRFWSFWVAVFEKETASQDAGWSHYCSFGQLGPAAETGPSRFINTRTDRQRDTRLPAVAAAAAAAGLLPSASTVCTPRCQVTEAGLRGGGTFYKAEKGARAYAEEFLPTSTPPAPPPRLTPHTCFKFSRPSDFVLPGNLANAEISSLHYRIV